MSIEKKLSIIDTGNSSWSDNCKRSIGSLMAVMLISGSLSAPVNAKTESIVNQLNQTQTEQVVNTKNQELNSSPYKSLKYVISNENLKPLFIEQITDTIRSAKYYHFMRLSTAIAEADRTEVENIINTGNFPDYFNLDMLKKDSNNLINQQKTDLNSFHKIISNNIKH